MVPLAEHHGIAFPAVEIEELCERYGIRRLALFGSILSRRFRPESDIDLLVEFKPGVRLGLRYFELEREFGFLLGRKVDLNTPGFLSPAIRNQVQETAEVLYDSAGR